MDTLPCHSRTECNVLFSDHIRSTARTEVGSLPVDRAEEASCIVQIQNSFQQPTCTNRCHCMHSTTQLTSLRRRTQVLHTLGIQLQSRRLPRMRQQQLHMCQPPSRADIQRSSTSYVGGW